MTDERLEFLSESSATQAERELLKALKAERARVVELESEIERIIASMKSCGGVVAYIRDRAETAESQLTTLRAGIQALLDDGALYTTVTVERVRLEELVGRTNTKGAKNAD